MTSLPATISRELRDPLNVIRHLPTLAAVGLVIYAIAAGGYFVTLVGFALIYAVLVTGLNIFMGLGGQASFGHNAFAALSGYTSAILTTQYEWAVLPAIGVGIAGAVLIAFAIGWPTLRLKGHYLAMATLAIGLIVYEIAVQWQSVTQGYMGISGIPSLGIGKWEAATDRQQLIVLSIVALVAMISAWRIRHSRFGRALVAFSGSEDAARALGIDVTRYKLAAFVLSAVYAAVAGSLFVHIVGFVSPEVFGMSMVIQSFTMLYVGGIGTVVGPLVGAVVISLLPETFRWLKEYMDIIYGIALVLILIYTPGGLASMSKMWRKKPEPAAAPATSTASVQP